MTQSFNSVTESGMQFRSQLNPNCESEKLKALFGCFISDPTLLKVTNVSYSDACVFSALQHQSSFVGLMTKATGADSKLLPSHGDTPRRMSPPILPPETVPPPTLAMRPVSNTPTGAVVRTTTQAIGKFEETVSAAGLDTTVSSTSKLVVNMPLAVLALCHFLHSICTYWL